MAMPESMHVLINSMETHETHARPIVSVLTCAVSATAGVDSDSIMSARARGDALYERRPPMFSGS